VADAFQLEPLPGPALSPSFLLGLDWPLNSRSTGGLGLSLSQCKGTNNGTPAMSGHDSCWDSGLALLEEPPRFNVALAFSVIAPLLAVRRRILEANNNESVFLVAGLFVSSVHTREWLGVYLWPRMNYMQACRVLSLTAEAKSSKAIQVILTAFFRCKELIHCGTRQQNSSRQFAVQRRLVVIASLRER
jgi:hypothetical protein